MRIGEVAARVGTTVRTIRYYEEVGLMPSSQERVAGAHRTYTEDDVEQLKEVVRLKELLGVTLEELRELIADEDMRRELRAEFLDEGTSITRRRHILDELEGVMDRQRVLVERRRAQLDELDTELRWRADRIAQRRGELDALRSGAGA
jgi:DNA-binding transcriptional MerR regulator